MGISDTPGADAPWTVRPSRGESSALILFMPSMSRIITPSVCRLVPTIAGGRHQAAPSREDTGERHMVQEEGARTVRAPIAPARRHVSAAPRVPLKVSARPAVWLLVCVGQAGSGVGFAGYGEFYHEAQGRPLPAAVAEHTCLTVGPSQVFLASAAPRSLDLRYFGPVAIDRIRDLVTPLLTWGASPE
jgi:hypothetical protein